MSEQEDLIDQVYEIICEGENFVDEPESVARDIVNKLHDRRADPPWFQKNVREQATQYLSALYGDDWVYWAPETFDNLLIRWVRYVAAGESQLAGETMNEIEGVAERLKAKDGAV
jgi:hypothetical protein